MSDTFLFYIKNIQEGWTAGVEDIAPDEVRKGWLHFTVVHNPNHVDLISGGISASHVFDSKLYDYGKDLNNLINKQQ